MVLVNKTQRKAKAKSTGSIGLLAEPGFPRYVRGSIT